MTTPDIPLNPKFVVAKVNTIIKIEPEPDASVLIPEDKFDLLRGQKLAIDACTFDANTSHYAITLENLVNNHKEWFVLKNHVTIT